MINVWEQFHLSSTNDLPLWSFLLIFILAAHYGNLQHTQQLKVLSTPAVKICDLWLWGGLSVKSNYIQVLFQFPAWILLTTFCVGTFTVVFVLVHSFVQSLHSQNTLMRKMFFFLLLYFRTTLKRLTKWWTL